MNPGTIMAAVPAVLALLVGLGLVLGGVAVLRRGGRDRARRVPVEAVCVERTTLVQPARVTLDHPVPGGWHRTTLVEGLPTPSVTGGTARAGDRVTLWADPDRPHDVRLAPAGSAGGVGGVLLLLVGALLCVVALLFAGLAVATVR